MQELANTPTVDIARLAELNIHVFLEHYAIKNQQGLKLEFKDRPFLWDIFEDMSPLQVVLKPPQIGMTTLEILKSMWVAKNLKRDIIYTLPTQTDVNDMAGGVINRLIAQNPILGEWIKDHDTVNQKAVGENMIYYRGTFTKKQAMMVPSGLNIHDEVDASDPSIIEQYETRLQSRSDGMRWYFSHPSVSDYGVDKYWKVSDQKHWFALCPHCDKKNYLSWSMSDQSDMSINFESGRFRCKVCKKDWTDEERAFAIRKGTWIKKYRDKDFSGYWVSQLMCSWIPASKIIADYKDKGPEYFYNYVLGLPYTGGDAKLTQQHLFSNLTNREADVADVDERVVIGIDTGLRLDYVLGNARLGLFFQGDSDTYGPLDTFMKRWKNAVAVMDAGGDLIGSRAFAARYPGRVFLAYAGTDRKTTELTRWGQNEESDSVTYDLNRMWQLCVDEIRTRKLPLQGTENDWWEYWLDWKNMSRIKIEDSVSGMFRGIKWVRNGRNHRASATLFWRIGMMRYGTLEQASLIGRNEPIGNMGYESKDGTTILPLVDKRFNL